MRKTAWVLFLRLAALLVLPAAPSPDRFAQVFF